MMKSEKQFKIVYNSLKLTKEVNNTIMDTLFVFFESFIQQFDYPLLPDRFSFHTHLTWYPKQTKKKQI